MEKNLESGMKARSRAALVFAAIALLCVAAPGFPAQAGGDAGDLKKEISEPQSGPAYTIRPGDSLYSISKEFHTSPEALKALNNLSGNRILAGETLIVPDTPADETSTKTGKTESLDYTVNSGDSLYKIAKSFHTTVNALKAANGLKSSRLQIGRVLKVPAAGNVAAEAPPAVTVAERDPAESPAAELPEKNVSEAIAAGEAAKPAAEEGNLEESELPLRERLVAAGLKMLGIRYRYSGTSEKTGLDCSALVRNLFSKFNITLPRSSREQYKQGEKVDRANLQAGDLVFFASSGKTPTHVGIYIGNNQFLHAARKARQVVVSDLDKLWYKTRYLGARRIMDLWLPDLSVSRDK
jgi:peptidoglycan endopeptidase LytE